MLCPKGDFCFLLHAVETLTRRAHTWVSSTVEALTNGSPDTINMGNFPHLVHGPLSCVRFLSDAIVHPANGPSYSLPVFIIRVKTALAVDALFAQEHKYPNNRQYPGHRLIR